MSVVPTLEPVGGSRARARPATVVVLAVLVGLLAIGAGQGGIAMVADPVQPLGLSPDYLVGTPVGSYLLPGWFLIGIALASLVTAAGLVLRWPWPWAAGIESAIGFRWPWIGAVSTGALLLVFEVVELFYVPFHPVMHPLLIAWSVAIVGLSITTSARRYLAAG